ncbi:MAG: hypothetical protein MUE37_01025 [Bacteroidales bacterium]|jgi:hypothetical protein|nr:hypothetical protein [Bacteroidales bacterium]
MKKLIAATIFFLAALFGSMAIGGGLGDMGPVLSFLSVMLSLGLMWFAVGMWKVSNKGKGNIDNPIDNSEKHRQE